MLELDCESRVSTLNSLSAIYGVAKDHIEEFLHKFDIDAHYAKKDREHSGDRELRLVFEALVGREATQLDRVFWFHLTRTPLGSTFSKGIQPLTDALPLVWRTVIDVFAGS